VLDGRKSELHPAADASRRRILADEIGMLRLEADELLHQGVELAVGDLRSVQDVVALFVVPDLAAELFDPFGGSHLAARQFRTFGGCAERDTLCAQHICV
jgi:hypothetical protein